MNTIKTLALATIIIGMASCASTPKFQMVGAFGKSTKLTSEEDSLFKAVKKRLRLSSMSHFQDRAMPAY